MNRGARSERGQWRGLFGPLLSRRGARPRRSL